MLYDIFGNHSQMTAGGVRLQLLQEVGGSLENFKQYEQAAYICLRMKEISLEDWLTKQTQCMVRRDEISEYVLSKLYNRHTMIHTARKTWCRILPVRGNVNYAAACHMHLLFMGNHMYGELRPKPLPQPALQLPAVLLQLAPSLHTPMPSTSGQSVAVTATSSQENVVQPAATAVKGRTGDQIF